MAGAGEDLDDRLGNFLITYLSLVEPAALLEQILLSSWPFSSEEERPVYTGKVGISKFPGATNKEEQMRFPKPSRYFSWLSPHPKSTIIKYILNRRNYDHAHRMRKAYWYRVRPDHHDYVEFFSITKSPVIVMIHRDEWEQIFPSN